MFTFKKFYLFLNYYLFLSLGTKILQWKWISGYGPILQEHEVHKYFILSLVYLSILNISFWYIVMICTHFQQHHINWILSIFPVALQFGNISRTQHFEVNLLTIPGISCMLFERNPELQVSSRQQWIICSQSWVRARDIIVLSREKEALVCGTSAISFPIRKVSETFLRS